MATVTELAAAVAAVIQAAMPEVDAYNLSSFEPAVTTQNVALIGSPLGQRDEAIALSVAGGSETEHRIRLQLWTKVVRGDEATGITTARNAGYRALRAVLVADGSTYDLAPGETLTAAVDEQVLVVGEIPFIRTTLTFPLWQAEE